jgi:hypothetical protein
MLAELPSCDLEAGLRYTRPEEVPVAITFFAVAGMLSDDDDLSIIFFPTRVR